MSAPYPPGQPQWPENPRPGDRPPPIQFRYDDSEPAPRRSPALLWTLRIVGLLAIAGLSGVVWFYINNEDPPKTPSGYDDSIEVSEGEFDFASHRDLPEPKVDDSCADHAYGRIQEFLTEHPCDRLTRAIYTTRVPDGRTVYTSVSVVRMPDKDEAAELRRLTDTDDTGNVNDLVREKVVTIAGLETLSGGGGYESAEHDRDVVIVEADYDPAARSNGKKADEELLDRVCKDALRMGTELSKAAG